MRSLFAGLALLAIPVVSAECETYVVAPDGSGDFPTIQDALDAAIGGDVIELTAGTFLGDGNRDLNFHGTGLTLRSQSGNAEACIIDCQGTAAAPHQGVLFASGEGTDARLEAVTITGGWTENRGGGLSCDGPVAPMIIGCRFLGNHARNGGGIGCFDGAGPTIADCYFAENEAEWSGGGVQAYCSAPVIADCTFYANRANHGGAMYVYGGGASPSVADCLFQDNLADHSTGGVHAEHFAGPSFHGCTFVGNCSMTSGAALTASIVTTVHLYGCTFWGNGAGSSNPSVANGEECRTTLENTIIASTLQGPAMGSYPGGSAVATLSCCDLYDNEGGDWVGEIAEQLGTEGNICANPLFCDPEIGDFTLAADSPCAPFSPPNEECDLIGAWPVGCGATHVSRVTWGGLKSRFK